MYQKVVESYSDGGVGVGAGGLRTREPEGRPHFPVEPAPLLDELGHIGLHDLGAGHPGQAAGEVNVGHPQGHERL